MNVPLHFLNKNDIKYIDYIIDIYLFISTEEEKLISHLEKDDLIKRLYKRQLLSKKEVINICSIIVLVTTCFDDSEINGLDIEEARHILLKIVTYHFNIIDDECFVDNYILFRYIYKSIKQSKKNMKLNKDEIYTYSFLKYLQI